MQVEYKEMEEAANIVDDDASDEERKEKETKEKEKPDKEEKPQVKNPDPPMDVVEESDSEQDPTGVSHSRPTYFDAVN